MNIPEGYPHQRIRGFLVASESSADKAKPIQSNEYSQDSTHPSNGAVCYDGRQSFTERRMILLTSVLIEDVLSPMGWYSALSRKRMVLSAGFGPVTGFFKRGRTGLSLRKVPLDGSSARYQVDQKYHRVDCD